MSTDRKEIDNKNEFSFIQEQIIPKRESKLKKITILILITILLAVLFGLVARYIFCVSESFYNDILGKSEKRGTITFPTKDQNESNNLENVENNPDMENQDDSDPSNTEINENKTIVIENSVEANVSDYVSMHNKIKEVAADVNKSIVTITSVENTLDWFNNDYEAKSITSGVILARDTSYLYILTSNDKIKATSNIRITFGDNVTVNGKFQESDSEINLAVVIVDVTQIPSSTLEKVKAATLGESYSISPGDPIIALGNPNGYSSSIELGIVSNKSNFIYTIDNKLDLLNTDINNNSNGDGVITNMEGDIVGIITQKFKTNLNEGINTAISISRLKPIIKKLVNDEPMVYLGIIGADMPPDIAKEYELSAGIYVTEVKLNSPAFRAGIKSGDIILAIGDKNTITVSALNNVLLEKQPDDVIKITIKGTIKAESKETVVDVTLVKKD